MSLEPRCRHGNIRSAEPCRDCDERDALRARVDELSRAYAVQGLAIEELTSERDRYREALKIIADPSTACMSWSETVHCLRAHARNALKPVL